MSTTLSPMPNSFPTSAPLANHPVRTPQVPGSVVGRDTVDLSTLESDTEVAPTPTLEAAASSEAVESGPEPLQSSARIEAVTPAPEASSSVEETGELADIVDHYLADGDLPSTEWLTRLHLDRPRRNIHCLSPFTRKCKRVLDILVAVAILILTLPIMLVTAVLVKLTSPGPIIYSQLRVGLNLRAKRNDRRQLSNAAQPPDGVERRDPNRPRRQERGYGKPFVLYKFRTMTVDAEKNGAQFAQKNDCRLTPIGWFLRKSRIDELPQLINVIRGEMSMVGPRPERPEFIEKLSADIPNYINRLGLKPGLTGVAQVINGYDNNTESFKRKVNLDLLYLQNCCLLNDLKILLRTVTVVLTGKGAL